MSINDNELKTQFKGILRSKNTKCPVCGGVGQATDSEAINFRCKWSLCRKRYNILRGTIFYHKKLPIETILKIIRMWSAKVRISSIAELLDISIQTISLVLKRLKTKVINDFYETQVMIGGKDIVVEIDESKFGKVKYHRGHKVDGVWVFGMVEKTPLRRIILIPVDTRTMSNLEDILIKYVHKDSIVHSDCFKSYNNLKNIFKGHLTVNHSLHYVDPITKTHTNTIEGNWSGVKDQVPPSLRSKGYVELYLIRYMLRRNYGKEMFKKILINLLSYFFNFLKIRVKNKKKTLTLFLSLYL